MSVFHVFVLFAHLNGPKGAKTEDTQEAVEQREETRLTQCILHTRLFRVGG